MSLVNDTQVTLGWIPPPGAGELYSVRPERWTGSSWAVQPAQTIRASASSPSAALGVATGLAKGTKYRFRVASSREGGSVGAYSSPSNAVTTLNSAPGPGPTPMPVSQTATSVRLEWQTERMTAADYTGGAAIVLIVIQAKEIEAANWTLERTVTPTDALAAGGGGSTSAFEYSGLASSRYYQFRMRLNNAIGNGTYGQASQSRLTLPGQMPPPILLAQPSAIVATWGVLVDPTYQAFEVGFAEYSGANNIWLPWNYRLAGKQETANVFSGLREDWQYRFTLAVRNAAGQNRLSMLLTCVSFHILLQEPKVIGLRLVAWQGGEHAAQSP